MDKDITKEKVVEQWGTYIGAIPVERALAIRKLNEEMEQKRQEYMQLVKNYERTMINMLEDAGMEPEAAHQLNTMEQVFVSVTGDVWVVQNEHLKKLMQFVEKETE